MQFTPEPLQKLITTLPAEFRPVTSPLPYQSVNGWSGASFWRWQAMTGPLILKVWPEDGPSKNEHVQRHRYLSSLKAFMPRIAIPLSNNFGQTIHPWTGGRWAELAGWIDGTPVIECPSDLQRNQALKALAGLHLHWANLSTPILRRSNAVADRLKQLRKLHTSSMLEIAIPELIKKAPSAIRERFESIHSLSRLLLDPAMTQLIRVQDNLYPLQVVIRDARPDHFLFLNDNLKGIIDLGAVGIDSIAVDLARLLSDWFPENWHDFHEAIEVYRQSRWVSESDLTLIQALTFSGSILGGLAWIDLHFRKNRTEGREDDFLKALDHAIRRLEGQANRQSIRLIRS